MSVFKNDFLIILFIFAVIFLFFFPYLSDNIPYTADFSGSDLTELNLPLRYLSAQFLKQGQIPLWTDQLTAGFPILAEGQAGVFYPFNLLFFVFLPFVTAVQLSIIINFLLANLFSYLYCRILKISKVGSLLAAVAFSFSGFFIFRLKHLNLVNAAVWLPLQLYLIEKFFAAKKKSVYVILLSFAFVIQFFAGHPQITYVSVVSCFFYFILRLFTRNNDYSLQKKVSQSLVVWTVITVITIGLAAVQFLPTYDFSLNISKRNNWVSYQNANHLPYHPGNLITFVSPYFFGNPAAGTYGNPAEGTYPMVIRSLGVFWENNIYFGLLPLILALIAIWFIFPKKNIVKVLVILIFFSFNLALGKYSPFFIVFWKLLPGMGFFRFHQRFLLLTLLSLTTLSGFGFDFIWQKLKSWQEKTGKLASSTILFSFLFPALILVAVVTDLYNVSTKYLGTLNYRDYLAPPQTAEFIQADSEIFRVASLNWMSVWSDIYTYSGGWQNNLALINEDKKLIPPNLNLFWHIAHIEDRSLYEGGLGGVSRFARLQVMLGGIETLNKKLDQERIKVLGLENVKYLLTFTNYDDLTGLELLQTYPIDFLSDLRLYKNNYFISVVKAYFKIEEFKDSSQVLDRLFDSDFDPQSTLLLEGNFNYQNNEEQNSKAKIVFSNNQETEKIIDVNFDRDGFLFLNYVNFPGWKVTVDGLPAELIKANYAFSAVAVPSGYHQVIFYFEYLPFIIGFWLSIFTLICLIFYFIFLFLLKSRKGYNN